MESRNAELSKTSPGTGRCALSPHTLPPCSDFTFDSERYTGPISRAWAVFPKLWTPDCAQQSRSLSSSAKPRVHCFYIYYLGAVVVVVRTKTAHQQYLTAATTYARYRRLLQKTGKTFSDAARRTKRRTRAFGVDKTYITLLSLVFDAGVRPTKYYDRSTVHSAGKSGY